MSEQLKKPYRIVTTVYVTLIFSFFLLFFDKNGLAAISTAKLRCYYALTLAYFASVIFLALYQCVRRRVTWSACRSELKSTPAAAWLITLYLLFTLVSSLLSDFDTVWVGGGRREGMLTISLYCISFLLICRFYRPRLWHLYLFAAATTAFCMICILQMRNVNVFGLYPLIGAKNSCADFIGAFIGTIGNIDFTASFLCIAIPIFWCSILRLKNKQRFFLAIPLLLCLNVLVKINVSAGCFGLIVGTLLTVPAVLPCGRKARISVWIAVGALFLAALILVYFIPIRQTELKQLHNILHGKIKDSYGTGRVYIWRRTLQAVPSHLWFGTGPDTMSLADFARQDVLDASGNLKYVRLYDAAHNEYLNILFHQGIFALLAYLSALGVTFVGWIRKSKDNAPAAIAGAAVLCYCLQAFFGISQLITSPFFWCTFAILVNVLQAKKEAREN
ncbi:MAG: O-antigen ligase family protein [Oscillospiraceae bacterium]|nr:O-antigen ligase family protein [Oscillospiraceae bacterium]